MPTWQDRIIALEKRIGDAEDQLAIYQLISSYGPTADSGNTSGVADQWTDEGTYSIDGIGTYEGKSALTSLFEDTLHQGYINKGSAHVNSLPFIRLANNRATATNYQQLFIWQGDHAQVIRSVASRWELIKTAAGWKVASRTNTLLDGREAGRTQLGKINEEPADNR